MVKMTRLCGEQQFEMIPGLLPFEHSPNKTGTKIKGVNWLENMKILFKSWYIVASTGQSEIRLYLATLSRGHNLIRNCEIVREHIKHYKVKTLHKLCASSLHSSLDLITQLKQRAALSQFWRSSCSSQGYIKSTVRVTATNSSLAPSIVSQVQFCYFVWVRLD